MSIFAREPPTPTTETTWVAVPTVLANQGLTTAVPTGAMANATPAAQSATHSRLSSRRTVSWSAPSELKVKQGSDTTGSRHGYAGIQLSGFRSNSWTGTSCLRKLREERYSRKYSRCSSQVSQTFRRSGVWIFGLFHNIPQVASRLQPWREQMSAPTGSAGVLGVDIKINYLGSGSDESTPPTGEAGTL